MSEPEAMLLFPQPRVYICPRTTVPPRLDGTLTDTAWDIAPWTEDYVDIEGTHRPAPPLRTRAKFLWDDTCLYVGIEAEEPDLWATFAEHDAMLFLENNLELFLDPDRDNHLYVEWEVNALGTTWDLLMARPYRDGGPYISGFELAGLRHAVHQRGTLNDPRDQDEGWSVEAAIPWSALRHIAGCACPPRAGDFWRMNLSRVQWQRRPIDGGYEKIPDQPESNWVWSSPGVIDMHRPERWGLIAFAEGDLGQDFAGDPAQPALDALARIYYAQRAHRKATGSYAASPKDLPEVGLPYVLEATANLWEASVRWQGDQWNIRHDSFVWCGERYEIPNTRPDPIEP